MQPRAPRVRFSNKCLQSCGRFAPVYRQTVARRPSGRKRRRLDEAIAIIQEGGNLLANTHKAFINGQWADAADGKTMDAGRDFRSGGGVVPLHDHRRCHPDGKDTPYGLSASIWIGNGTRGLALAGRIKAGTVWINEHLIIFCDTSWGGCKESGWGKDLSKMVLEEYTLTKHIYLDLTEEVEKPW